MIIAIDGPAGSGKSTTARAVARHLGFRHLDSGAFYRTITLAALRNGIPVSEWPSLDADRLDGLGVGAHLAGNGFEMRIGGEPVSHEIRGDDVNADVSRMARVAAVRDWLYGRLRAAAADTSLVCDGRDMGTVVFPEADFKFFLTADLRTRALRRLAQRGESADSGRIDAEIARIAERDRLDTEREFSPLRPAPGAILIDTSGLTFEEQVAMIVGIVRDGRPDTGSGLPPAGDPLS